MCLHRFRYSVRVCISKHESCLYRWVMNTKRHGSPILSTLKDLCKLVQGVRRALSFHLSRFLHSFSNFLNFQFLDFLYKKFWFDSRKDEVK